MMPLIATLIENGILTTEAVVTARTTQINRYGMAVHTQEDYLLKSITSHSDGYRLSLSDLLERYHVQVGLNDITAIDGMSLDRYAEVYNINSDGSQRSIGRKRGRKPKIRPMA